MRDGMVAERVGALDKVFKRLGLRAVAQALATFASIDICPNGGGPSVTEVQAQRQVPRWLVIARYPNSAEYTRYHSKEWLLLRERGPKGTLNYNHDAEGYLIGKGGKKPIGTVAREAVQMAEDSRIITIKKQQAEALAQERADAAAREERAVSERAAAQRDAERAKADVESARNAAQLAAQNAANEKAASERARIEALNQQQTAQAQAEAARVAAKADADRAAAEVQAARTQAQTAQAQAEATRVAAKAEADRAVREKAELEQAREAAVRQQELAKAETENAKRALAEADRLRQQAESEKEGLRLQLLRQFNLILETRDSARGLIVNMSDVLFDTGQFSLRPGAREKLAKVAGIILGHPGLKIEVEGHTDSVGGDDFNQKLSEHRSGSVRDYLVKQGLPIGSITAMGFGKTRPVAGNDTAAGRQQNRRVELVVSGEILGNPLNPGSR